MPPSETVGDRLTQFLHYETVRTSQDEASSWIPARPDLLNRDGALKPIPLAFLIESTPAVVCGAAAAPDGVVATDVHMHVLDPRVRGRIRADAKLVRAGRLGVLAEVTVVDEGDAERVIAVGSVNHGRVPLTDGGDPPQLPVGGAVRPPGDAPQPADIAALDAAVVTDPTDTAGVATHHMTPLTTDPLGILHGSVTASLAMQAALACAGPGWRVSEVMLRFIASISQGPARAIPQLLDVQASRALVRVNVYDAPRPNRLATAAWITLAR